MLPVIARRKPPSARSPIPIRRTHSLPMRSAESAGVQILYADSMDRQMQQHEAWRLQYRGERYLRDQSDSELFTRAGDLMTVTLGHSRDGRIGMDPAIVDPSKLERFTRVLEEFVIRGIDHRQPGILEAMRAPRPNSPKVSRALQTLTGKRWPNRILVKFGERKHMASLFIEGKGRVSLARTYSDPSLGYARADDEAQISVYVHPTDAHRLMAVEQTADGSRGLDVAVPYLGSVKVNLQATTDFYVYCMAESCDVRMFDDFTTAASDVDTCVIVTRPDEFKARIQKAVAARLPGWRQTARRPCYLR